MLTRDTATIYVAKDHPAADGHFPGNPIIPGAVLLRDIIDAICAAGSAAVRCREIRSAKFHHPIRPGDEVVIRWTVRVGGEVRFTGSVAGSELPAVTGTITLSPP